VILTLTFIKESAFPGFIFSNSDVDQLLLACGFGFGGSSYFIYFILPPQKMLLALKSGEKKLSSIVYILSN